MTTTIELLQVIGLLAVTFFTRAALVLAAVMVLSLPIMAWAYGVRAAKELWRNHHHLHAAHHA